MGLASWYCEPSGGKTASLGVGTSIPMARPTRLLPATASPLSIQTSVLRRPSTTVALMLRFRSVEDVMRVPRVLRGDGERPVMEGGCFRRVGNRVVGIGIGERRRMFRARMGDELVTLMARRRGRAWLVIKWAGEAARKKGRESACKTK